MASGARSTLDPATRGEAGLRLAAYADPLISTCRLATGRPPGVVAAFIPMRDEINPLPLLSALIASGWTGALPVVVARDKPLQFRSWSIGDALEDGPFGTRQPTADAALVEPDLLLVPLLAYDARRHRLGYGGGYYDRTLAHLRIAKTVLAAGVAYSAQERESVPVDPWDAPLDLVLTERGIV